MSTLDRATAALQGLAIGDALGMPTQMMSRAAVHARYGRLSWFEAAEAGHPLAAGLPAGSITDDTEQALLFARLLLEGRLSPETLARELVAWEERMRARGSLDLLGPSTARAVAALLAGEPVETSGRYGATNGAAMRITPVGIAVDGADVAALVTAVTTASMASHNTGLALAGAAAVAAAVSAGVGGAGFDGALDAALVASRLAAASGFWVAGADVSRRIAWAVDLVDPADVERSLDDVSQLVGTSLATQESVPAAFALVALFPGDPWSAVTAAASLGGDSDTVAAMAGAIAGAVGGAFPADAVALVARVNGLDLPSVAAGLVELR